MIVKDKALHNDICNTCINNPQSVFKPLSKEEKAFLKDNMTCFLYRKGDIIYKEGDKPAGLICLSKGKAKIFKQGIGKREQIVRLANAVGFIGYRAMFAQENHIATGVAIEDCTTSVVPSDIMLKLIRTNPDLALNIIKAFATDLGFSNRRTVTLTQKHIRGRLAESLLVLADTYGYEEDNETIKVYLSREDLANLSNMTTSNAIRTLSCFSNEGLIKIYGRKIQIKQKKELENISNMG